MEAVFHQKQEVTKLNLPMHFQGYGMRFFFCCDAILDYKEADLFTDTYYFTRWVLHRKKQCSQEPWILTRPLIQEVPERPLKRRLKITELKHTTDVFNTLVHHEARRLGASLRTLMREGYGQWAGNWILGTEIIHSTIHCARGVRYQDRELFNTCTQSWTRHVSSRCPREAGAIT